LAFGINGLEMISLRLWQRVLPLAAAALAPAACASYQPLPLSAKSPLAESLGALDHAGIPVTAPLDITAVAALAVRNNPDLIAARAQHGIAQAQLLQAGLLPNPTITANYAPNLYAPNATTNAWNVAVGADLRAIITRPARESSARAARDQVDAQLLWQEWQTAGQARLLAVDLIEGERTIRLLGRTRDLLADRAKLSEQALARGDTTLPAVAPDLGALQTARTALDDANRVQLARQHQLNALLGLAPGVLVPLAPAPDLPPLDPTQLRRSLATLADRRPDLAALRFGYRSEEEKVRAAILAQFPTFSLGTSGGEDNTHDYSFGPQVTFELPIFDHNQGQIAIERATRQQLHDAYAARLAASLGEVSAKLAEIAQLQRQLRAAREELPQVTHAATRAEAALRAGNIDERSYVDLVSARYAKQQQIVTLEQALLEQEVALATLVGAGLPPLILAQEEARS
jgi:outer membrane protein TolC